MEGIKLESVYNAHGGSVGILKDVYSNELRKEDVEIFCRYVSKIGDNVLHRSGRRRVLVQQFIIILLGGRTWTSRVRDGGLFQSCVAKLMQ